VKLISLIALYLVTSASFVQLTPVMAQTKIPFTDGKDADTWYVINDGVMGGVSESEITQKEAAVGFKGVVRLENNGGFASMRKQVKPVLTFIEDPTIEIEVRGDGNTYECRFRMANNRLSYVHSFATTAGEITKLSLPVKDFQPSFRGRKFDVDEVGYLDIGKFAELGILIANKQRGPFQIDVYEVTIGSR